MKNTIIPSVLTLAGLVSAQWWGGAPDCAVSHPFLSKLITHQCSNSFTQSTTASPPGGTLPPTGLPLPATAPPARAPLSRAASSPPARPPRRRTPPIHPSPPRCARSGPRVALLAPRGCTPSRRRVRIPVSLPPSLFSLSFTTRKAVVANKVPSIHRQLGKLAWPRRSRRPWRTLGRQRP
jgi:hypothetical protein